MTPRKFKASLAYTVRACGKEERGWDSSMVEPLPGKCKAPILWTTKGRHKAFHSGQVERLHRHEHSGL